MPRRHSPRRTGRVGFGLLWLALVMLPLLAVAGPRALPGKDDTIGRRAAQVPYLPETFPCDQPRLEVTLTMSMFESYVDTTSGDNVVSSYACNPGVPLTGPEHIYVLTAGEDMIVDLGLADNDPDLDLVLLSDCDTDSCIVQSNTELSVELFAGATVYLVVDGYNGAAGEYELRLETRPLGIPDQICDGGAVELGFAGTDTIDVADTLFDRANLVSIYECAPYTVRGGEIWYAMSFAPADTDTVGTGHGEMIEVAIAAVPGSQNLDLVLWLFADCGLEAECLVFVDDTNAGVEEVLRWSNPLAEPLTVYLAVDCIARPDSAAAGNFNLEFLSAVPVETRSLSSVRNRFR